MSPRTRTIAAEPAPVAAEPEVPVQTALKVIGKDFGACHGGRFDYTDYLPKDGAPGPWLPKVATPKACERGYHVTSREWAAMWWLEDARLYRVEVRGKSHSDEPNKTAWSEMRLLEEVTWSAETQVWDEGEHEVTAGAAKAYGSSQVTAYDSSQVTASGSSQVTSNLYHSASAVVAIERMAVHIDRRNGKLAIRTAAGAGATHTEVQP